MDIDLLVYKVLKIEPGQRLVISRDELSMVITRPFENNYKFPIQDWVLERIVGSAFEYGYTMGVNGDVTYFRLPTPIQDGIRKTYVSPDRRHLYMKDANGIYHPKRK